MSSGILPKPPGVPIFLKVEASPLQVRLSWTHDPNNTIGYRLERSVNGVNRIQVYSGQIAFYHDLNVAENMTYHYRVSAWNGDGESGFSTTTVTLSSMTFTAAAVTTSRIDLTWMVIAGAVAYRLERSLNGITWTEISSAITGTNHSVTGLSTNTFYHFRLSARNSDMAYSNYATTSATTLANALTTAPTGLAATVSGTIATRLDLSWNSVTGATGYRLERSANGTSGWTAVHTGTATTYSNTGLTAGTKYFFRVFATNSAGDSPPSAVLEAMTLCNAPSGVTAVAQDRTTDIKISWTATTGAASYIVEWATTSSGTYTALPSVTGTTTTHAVGSTNVARFYRVKAVNASGNSANSSTVNTKTAPAPPTNFTATVVSQTQINLSATAPDGATKNKFEYQQEGAGSWTTAQDNANTTCSVTGLTANTKYNFRVSSDNL